MSDIKKGLPVYSRGRTMKGEATGAQHECTMEGCTGSRISVKWPDGTHTFPCSKGMNWFQDCLEII